MSNLPSTIKSVSDWWNSEGAEQEQKLAGLSRAAKDRAQDIADIKTHKSTSILDAIKSVWKRATLVPDLQDVRQLLLDTMENGKENLAHRSAADADRILAAAAAQSPALAERLEAIDGKRLPMLETLELLETARTKTKSLIRTINTAWDETDEASSNETVDMVFSNRFSSFVSTMETADAVEHLEKVGAEIKDYKAFMEKHAHRFSSLQFTDLRAKHLGDIATTDMWMGMFDLDVFSFFSSWENMEQLETAKEKLEQLGKQLGPVLKKIETAHISQQGLIDVEQEKYLRLRAETVRDAGLPDNFYKFLPDAPAKTAAQTPKMALQF